MRYSPCLIFNSSSYHGDRCTPGSGPSPPFLVENRRHCRASAANAFALLFTPANQSHHFSTIIVNPPLHPRVTSGIPVEKSSGVCPTLKKILTFALLCLCYSIPALAQDPAPIEIGGVTFSGNIRERYEAWDFFTPTAANSQNLYGFSGTQIRFGISQSKTNYDWNIEFEAPILLGIPSGAVLAAPQGQLGLGGSYYAANDKAPIPRSFFRSRCFSATSGRSCEPARRAF